MEIKKLLKRRYVKSFVQEMKTVGSTREDVIKSAVHALHQTEPNFIELYVKEQLKNTLDQVYGS